jgi:long-chain fatty acid transport protein
MIAEVRSARRAKRVVFFLHLPVLVGGIMRNVFLVTAMLTLAAAPAATQNTDIESLSGLQFNFGNPGARSLGMGGAFLGLADDASAAEANPAGLTILRKPEVSIELRDYKEQQIFTTSGTYPDINRTAFSHYNHRVTFGSIVVPIKNFTVGAYYHEPLHNQGSGEVMPVLNKLSGALITDVPIFYLPKNGPIPVSKSDCDAINQKANDPTACLGYTIVPFLSEQTVQESTFGFAAAYKIGKLSFGGTVRRQKFNESAFTFRDGTLPSIVVEATSDITQANEKAKDQNTVTFAGGVKWNVTNDISVGAVYKHGPKYVTPTFIANADTNYEFVKAADTTFHVPDIYGIGVSANPIPVLKVNADAVHVTYSNLADNFFPINAGVRAFNKAFKANDVTELHLGAEYFFLTKIPFAVRAGVWRDPAHSVQYRGPLTVPDAVGDAILYPKGSAQRHISVGAGLAWTKFQIDAAFDRSPHYSVGSISMVSRF